MVLEGLFPGLSEHLPEALIIFEEAWAGKMRFLCLHGKGTSARIFKSQTGMPPILGYVTAIQ